MKHLSHRSFSGKSSTAAAGLSLIVIIALLVTASEVFAEEKPVHIFIRAGRETPVVEDRQPSDLPGYGHPQMEYDHSIVRVNERRKSEDQCRVT